MLGVSSWPIVLKKSASGIDRMLCAYDDRSDRPAADDQNAVSYTHLDVYKRQPHEVCVIVHLSLLCPRDGSLATRFPGLCFANGGFYVD